MLFCIWPSFCMFLAHYGHPEAADETRRLNLNCFLHSIAFNGGRSVFGGSKASRRLLSGAGGGAFSSAYMPCIRQLDLPSLVGVDSCYTDLHSH